MNTSNFVIYVLFTFLKSFIADIVKSLHTHCKAWVIGANWSGYKKSAQQATSAPVHMPHNCYENPVAAVNPIFPEILLHKHQWLMKMHSGGSSCPVLFLFLPQPDSDLSSGISVQLREDKLQNYITMVQRWYTLPG